MHVQRSVGMQIKSRGARLGGRPYLRFAPFPAVKEPSGWVLVTVAGAHQKISHRRLSGSRRLDAFQVVVKPCQMETRVEVLDRGIGAEIDVARKSGGITMMRPGSDDQPHRRFFESAKPAPIF